MEKTISVDANCKNIRFTLEKDYENYSYCYIKETGNVLFAGRKTKYYGLENINDLVIDEHQLFDANLLTTFIETNGNIVINSYDSITFQQTSGDSYDLASTFSGLITGNTYNLTADYTAENYMTDNGDCIVFAIYDEIGSNRLSDRISCNYQSGTLNLFFTTTSDSINFSSWGYNYTTEMRKLTLSNIKITQV